VATKEEGPETDLLDVILSTDEITEYLNATIKVHECPSCGENEWVVLTDPDMEFGLTSARRDRGTPSVIIAAIPMVCGKCGHIKSYAKRAIVNWLQARGKK